MPGQPTPQDLHVNQLLTNVSIGYVNDMYISDQIAPMLRVNKQSNIVPKYDQSPWFRDDARLRAPGTKSAGGGWTVDTSDTYFCNRFSRRMEIPDELRGNADPPWQLDIDAARFVTDKVMMRREVDFASNYFTTGEWGTDVTTGFTQWSNYGASTPDVNVTSWKNTVSGLIAKEPNTFTVGNDVHIQLKNHPTLLDRIKYTQRAQMTKELIASLFEVDKYLVGTSIYTTDIEGTAEASVTYSRIWGKHALMMYVPPSPTLFDPAAIFTPVWQVVPNALQYIKRMRNEEKEIDIIEANSYFTRVVTSANSGLFVSSLVA